MLLSCITQTRLHVTPLNQATRPATPTHSPAYSSTSQSFLHRGLSAPSQHTCRSHVSRGARVCSRAVAADSADGASDFDMLRGVEVLSASTEASFDVASLIVVRIQPSITPVLTLCLLHERSMLCVLRMLRGPVMRRFDAICYKYDFFCVSAYAKKPGIIRTSSSPFLHVVRCAWLLKMLSGVNLLHILRILNFALLLMLRYRATTVQRRW